ncbi:MAG: hypothetical protein KDD70_02325 [Bdellovibrionales bacterium]|nr:hypothetical protein [Bdellovibrionales bacterium]
MSTANSSDEFKNASSVRIELDRAQQELEQLRTLYEQYFIGILQFPPDQLHQKMQRTIRKLRNAPFKNSQTNYQLRMLEQRYQTYATYWKRVMREREEGTYFRDVFKAELRERVAREDAEGQTQRGKVKANVKALFDTYQDALERQAGKKLKLDYEKFQKRLVQQAKSFKEKNGNKKLSFKVVVEEGKVRVRATTKE